MSNPEVDPFILERVIFIPALVDTNPEGGDPLEYCDDHIRLIKNVLKNNFPNFDGPLVTDGKFWGYFQKIFTVDPTIPSWYNLNGNYTPAATFTDETVTLKSIPKNLTIQSDGVVLAKEPDAILGMPFYSMLTMDEMTGLYGANKYVLCNGMDYPDSQMFKETGISRVPDLITALKEYYPRASTTNVGTLVESTTGATGLTITGVDSSHDHGAGAHTHTLMDSDGFYFDGDVDDKDPQHNTSSISAINNTADATITFNNTPYVHNHNPLTFASTDAETTPAHFYANYLIRIN